ncbi:MAG: hypothetical protein DLM68_03870, partial [Hyphomicrobiales bacterium]
MEADPRAGSGLLQCGNFVGAYYGCWWLSPAAAQVPEDIQQLVSHRGHALLIGVSTYTNGWNPLPNVQKDLDDLEKGLKPHFQKIEKVLNPTVDELRTRIRDFLLVQWNKPDERLFIYYSGHGFTELHQFSRRDEFYITGSDTPGRLEKYP